MAAIMPRNTYIIYIYKYKKKKKKRKKRKKYLAGMLPHG